VTFGPEIGWGTSPLENELTMQFNRSLRLYARKMGYSLNQRGLYKGVIRGKDGLKVTEGGSIRVDGQSIAYLPLAAT
jgi:DNA polymerase lambda